MTDGYRKWTLSIQRGLRRRKRDEKNLESKKGVLLTATERINEETAGKQAYCDANAYLHHTESNRKACRVRITLLTAIIL